MKNLVEIINFIENLKNDYKEQREQAMWHATITIGSKGNKITFFIDLKTKTKELRERIKKELGKPKEKTLWEGTESYDDFVTYKYENENE